MFQGSAYICFSHLQHQKSRIQRKLFFQSCLQDPHEACYVVLSGDESFQSEPKLTIQISKALFVVIPAAVEIN